LEKKGKEEAYLELLYFSSLYFRKETDISDFSVTKQIVQTCFKELLFKASYWSTQDFESAQNLEKTRSIFKLRKQLLNNFSAFIKQILGK